MHGRYQRIAAVSLLALAGACATRDGFRLVHPPGRPEANFPGGYRLLTNAPLADWSVVGQFPDRDACEQAKRAAAEDAVTTAQARAGDKAKYDLDLRRAVNARCVRATAER
jgi:hypothetical protein